MRLPIYQVDAFAAEVFAGNPAAVVVLERGWLEDRLLAAIASENNLSETAFLVPADGDEADYELRWFTPTVEVELCGHATLASGHVLMRHLGWAGERVRFRTRMRGIVGVERGDEGRLVLDFPAIEPVAHPGPEGLAEGLGATPAEVVASDTSAAPGYVAAVFGSAEEIRTLRPDFRRLAGVGIGMVIATGPGAGRDDAPDGVDFVSRFFAPGAGIDEDPVTGSVHCLLTAYWSSRLGRRSMRARQLSARGGELWVECAGDRVRIAGHAVTYLVGEIEVGER